MKGILLAGGSGKRLYPLTEKTSKQLLPVYDKPMIYYPLSTLLLLGIKDILIISTPKDTPNIEKLFHDGAHLGVHISYKVQEEPRGIPEAFKIGADFIANDDVCLILGDNIFYTPDQFRFFKKLATQKRINGATLFAKSVPDPNRSGVVEFDESFNVLSLEEKPEHPKSDYVSVGLYFYPADVVQQVESLALSDRGEYEITDLNNLYLQEKRLSAVPLDDTVKWIDAGTHKSLFESCVFVRSMEKRQGIKIACLEEIAYRKHFITDKQFLELIDKTDNTCETHKYLKRIYQQMTMQNMSSNYLNSASCTR